MPIRIIIAFAVVGVALEVFWTSIADFIKTKNPRLTGKSYLWMFPIYAFVPFIYVFVLRNFPRTNIFIRGIIYMISFYLLEFITGYLIKKLVGKSPWNYEKHSIIIFDKKYKTNFMGLVCLEYDLFFYFYGIIGEYLFKYLTRLQM